MRCEYVRLTNREGFDVIECDSIHLAGNHMPGFYEIWRNGVRQSITNGAHILQVFGCKHELDRNPITII